MFTLPRWLLPCLLLPGAMFLTACGSTASSASAGPYSLTKRLPHSFGTKESSDGGSICEVAASAPSHSPLKKQQLMLYVDRFSLAGTSSSGFFMATGASKSLEEVQQRLAQGLRNAATAAPGAELFKLGDIKYGGEVRVIALGGGRARFLYNPAPSGSTNPDLSAEEVTAFVGLLTH